MFRSKREVNVVSLCSTTEVGWFHVSIENQKCRRRSSLEVMEYCQSSLLELLFLDHEFKPTSDSSTDYIFDELGIYAYNSSGISSEYLLTHVIFHPVQKSLNRVIEIVYTIRVQLQ